MKTTLYIVFSLAMWVCNAGAEVSATRKQELIERFRDQFAKADDLPQDEQAFILDWILTELATPDRNNSYTFVPQLIELGHRPTIERFALDYPHLRYDQAWVLQNLRQPRLLPIFAKVLFKNEPPILPQVSDVTRWPVSVSASAHILRTLAGSREIPADVRAWALNVDLDAGHSVNAGERLRSIVRDWWSENAAACEREDYASLEPGAKFNEKEKTPEPEPAKTVLPEPNPGRSDESHPRTKYVNEPIPESNAVWLLVAAVLAGILSIALWIACRRR